jgi:hypothetical protein
MGGRDKIDSFSAVYEAGQLRKGHAVRALAFFAGLTIWPTRRNRITLVGESALARGKTSLH